VTDTVLDVVSIAFLLIGSALALLAGIGLVRFPDVLARLHAGTKPQVTGVLFIMIGGAVRLEGLPVMTMLIMAGLLQLLTAPVSAHLIGRVAYRCGHVRADLVVVHEDGDEGDRPAG
jgi:multicomponent Na+:H+ antiporter subunit G